jgi:hypothetical protein
MPLVGRLFNALSGRKVERYGVYTRTGQIVGYAELSFRLRASGVNEANLRISSDHPELAAFMVGHAISAIQKASPGHRIEIHLENWGTALIQALEGTGGEKRLSYHRMGFRFQT